jgi:outer membrane protein insertion porin family
MKRLLILIAVFLVVPAFSLAQESKMKRIAIFPLKIVSKGAADTFSNDLAAVLGAELAREGDVEATSAGVFLPAVRDKNVDPARIARIVERMQAYAAIWGTVTKLDDGYALELSVMEADPRKKPTLFTATGKNMEEVVTRMKDLSTEIGSSVLKRPKIGHIKIEGNRRIQQDAILKKIDMKTGSPFRKSALSDEIREIYSMGYFDDVQIRAEEASDGVVDLYIALKERPSISSVEIQGNKLFSKDEILDALKTKSFSVVSLDKIRSDIDKIKKMYEKAGYYQAKVDYETKELSRNEATLIFKIDEGVKSYLTDLAFEGRDKLPEKDIQGIMTVKPKSWTWFLDETGTFSKEKLEENRLRIMQFYHDHGFIAVQVGEPVVDFKNGSVKVTYPIREGNRFQVRKVDVSGDLIIPKEKLEGVLETKPKTWFKRSSVAEDIKVLTKIYNNMGYAFADVEPAQDINEKYNFIDLTYKIHKGERVTIEKVDVAGNERTRDKVIRRSLTISEGDLYNASKFDQTKNALEGMDFFEGVKIKTAPGSRPDLVNVTVEVMEKKTGSLSAGFGFSSQEGAMGNIDLKERNLLGLGIVANAKANVSARRMTYEGTVTYPWIFDFPLSTSLRVYKSSMKESFYWRDVDGFSTHVNYPVYGFWSLQTGISRESNKLRGQEQLFARSMSGYYSKWNVAARKYQNFSENSVTASLTRDTRDNGMIPTAGSKIVIGSRFSGFGADVAYSNYYSDLNYYYRVYWKAILKVHTNAAMLAEASGEPIPMDRRLLLGGIQTIRGWQHSTIGPLDVFGQSIGGDRAAFTNVECLFPIAESYKLFGVTFLDAGNSWNAIDGPFPKDIKAGAGIGIRWVSPMGPLRIEYGWKLTPRKGEELGAFAFSMGQLF